MKHHRWHFNDIFGVGKFSVKPADTCDNVKMESPTSQILAKLPQTQCRQCGFDGCKSYAAALADTRSSSNLCPPGGVDGQLQLNLLLDSLGLDQAISSLGPAAGPKAGSLRASIDAQICIGCTRCIDVCPVDAIVGAPKRLHAVIEVECTGCDLCRPVCPVDCITLLPAKAGLVWDDAARQRARERDELVRRRKSPQAGSTNAEVTAPDASTPSLVAILAKARQRLASRPGQPS
jgi:Na+-translocating ferredoxin:NAD+ oxidoreductase subunit B